MSTGEMEALVRRIEQHAAMCADFERMSTGQFREKYPDYLLGREGGERVCFASTREEAERVVRGEIEEERDGRA